MDLVREKYPYSERRICRALGIARSSIRYLPQPRSDEAPLRSSIIRLASAVNNTDYLSCGRNLRALGLEHATRDEILAIVDYAA